DNIVPKDELTSSVDPILDNVQVPAHLIPLIPKYPLYVGGLLNQPSRGKMKGKKLQPLMVGSDAWLAHMEEIYIEHEKELKYEKLRLEYTIKWEVDLDRAEFRENLLRNVVAYTDALHDYESKKLEIASRPPVLPVPKNKKKGKQKIKNTHVGKASTSTSTPVIMTDEKILKDLENLVSMCEHTVVMTISDALYYNPELMVMDANLKKRRADTNGNLDSHYGLYIPKKVCTAPDRLGSDTSSFNDTK
ncbi:hypothetical protein RhiirA4_490796, partial [Rhizophagus irregularis]